MSEVLEHWQWQIAQMVENLPDSLIVKIVVNLKQVMINPLVVIVIQSYSNLMAGEEWKKGR